MGDGIAFPNRFNAWTLAGIIKRLREYHYKTYTSFYNLNFIKKKKMNPHQAKALLERELPGILERVAVAKKQFDNYAVLSVINSQIEVYEICKSLSLYAYQIEAVALKQAIIQRGLPEIAEDFFHSAASPNNMQSILKENADTLKSYCKLFGKNIDAAFQEISDNSNKYLLFLAEDAQGAKQFVPQMYLASKGTIISVNHPWRQ